MSFRLDKQTRATIVSRVIKGRFDKRDKQLHDRVAKLAKQCYDKQYPPKVKALMDSLPGGWLSKDGDIKVQFGENSRNFKELSFNGIFPGDYNCKRPIVEFVFPQCDVSTCRLKLDDDHWLAKEWYQLESDIADYKTERSAVENEVAGVIESFTTSGKLVGAWPEVERFLKDLVPVEKTNVPAPMISSLNEKLGLKKAA